jgi:hypothetical protein
MNNIDHDLNWVNKWIRPLPIFKYLFINIESLPININKCNSIYRQIIKIYHPDYDITNLSFNSVYLKLNITIKELKEFKKELEEENKNGEFISFIKLFIIKYLTDKTFCDKIKSLDDTLDLIDNNNLLNNLQLDYKNNYDEYKNQYKKKELTKEELSNLYNKTFNKDEKINDKPLNQEDFNNKFNDFDKYRNKYVTNINKIYEQEQNTMNNNKIGFDDMFNNKLTNNNNLFDNDNMSVISFNETNNVLDKYNLMSLNQDENISFETQFNLKTTISNNKIKPRTLEELMKEREELLNK